MSQSTIVCTNCTLEIAGDPGAAGNKCPKCGNGGLVPEGSEMVQ